MSRFCFAGETKNCLFNYCLIVFKSHKGCKIGSESVNRFLFPDWAQGMDMLPEWLHIIIMFPDWETGKGENGKMSRDIPPRWKGIVANSSVVTRRPSKVIG